MTTTLTVKVPHEMAAKLAAVTSKKRVAKSKYIRDALDVALKKEKQKPSLYDLMMEAGAIGCFSSGKGDLSTNPKYLEGYGQDNHRRRTTRRAA